MPVTTDVTYILKNHIGIVNQLFTDVKSHVKFVEHKNVVFRALNDGSTSVVLDVIVSYKNIKGKNRVYDILYTYMYLKIIDWFHL